MELDADGGGEIGGDLPAGVGLSSSAALLVALGLALCDVAGLRLAPLQLAQACRRAEERAVGLGVTRGLTWGAGILGATAVGVVFGLHITPRWFALGLVPLLGFSVGGLILSTHLSSTRGYAGGDWSVAAVVALGGVVDGVIATLALLVTLLACAPLRAAIRQRT